MLADLAAQAQGAVIDIRRLVHALRPPALDDLGLVGAIRATMQQLGFWEAEYGSEDARSQSSRARSRNDPAYALDVPEHLPPLPAAVEVAAYRIAQEAITNVVRHAGARRCAIRLAADDALRVEIADDGCGLPDGAAAGVGLISMRERARELGGDCQVERGAAGGTIVRAWLPL
jgi:signal transduction histidine kinase